MKRYEAIQIIMDEVTDEVVICNIGHPSQELYLIKDRPRNFYMLGSMGLASSIGLGIALSQPGKVVVIDGEGSVLMNMGTLATIGINQPKNLSLFIIDNESYGSTGFQPTFTSQGIDLEKIAASCQIRNSKLCRDKDDCRRTIRASLEDNSGPACVIIKTDKSMPDHISPIPYDSIYIKKRFMESLRASIK